MELEKPLDDTIPPSEPSAKDLRCRVIIREYHAFLGVTVKFLHEVQERQMRWRWGNQSPVFEAMSWLQGLWASRKTVCWTFLSATLFFPFLLNILLIVVGV